MKTIVKQKFRMLVVASFFVTMLGTPHEIVGQEFRPIAGFNHQVEEGCVKFTPFWIDNVDGIESEVAITGTDVNNYIFEWRFGNDWASVEALPCISFPESGDFRVVLRVKGIKQETEEGIAPCKMGCDWRRFEKVVPVVGSFSPSSSSSASLEINDPIRPGVPEDSIIIPLTIYNPTNCSGTFKIAFNAVYQSERLFSECYWDGQDETICTDDSYFHYFPSVQVDAHSFRVVLIRVFVPEYAEVGSSFSIVAKLNEVSFACQLISDKKDREVKIMKSIDPNDKRILNGQIFDWGDRVDYAIDFHNKGELPEFYINLEDNLSPLFDLNSIQVHGVELRGLMIEAPVARVPSLEEISRHPSDRSSVNWALDGRTLKVRIHLSTSHELKKNELGTVRFSIRLVNELPSGFAMANCSVLLPDSTFGICDQCLEVPNTIKTMFASEGVPYIETPERNVIVRQTTKKGEACRTNIFNLKLWAGILILIIVGGVVVVRFRSGFKGPKLPR